MPDFDVPLGISSRHVHLTQEHVDILFGRGHKLTPTKALSQPGQFASDETVTIVGNKGSLEGVRVLGPVRNYSQVELATTDTFKLGVKAPVRESGELEGTPGIELVGPVGKLKLNSGVIIAARHIHMTPEEAKEHGLKDGDHVSVEIPGSRGGVLDEVLIRVSPKFELDMHVDTDEGNAFNLHTGDTVEVLPQERDC
ncbi:phosphate propanoyltransferase [Paradesulfitobacterium aromaticivorans]